MWNLVHNINLQSTIQEAKAKYKAMNVLHKNNSNLYREAGKAFIQGRIICIMLPHGKIISFMHLDNTKLLMSDCGRP